MNNYYTSYQLQGLDKLLSFKPRFEHPRAKTVSHAGKTAAQQASLNKETVQEFTRVFCDHLLADTDYAALQKEEFKYQSPLHIANMQLDVILKVLTYIIWTDRIVEGYFLARIKDMTLVTILNRLEVLLMHNYNKA